ncbi:MAG TPA: class I SAM-dependent methyltransferase [Caldilineaceae bacterium]|nr:class I SAM-dependent methyltransferase [Caldilineaceae bacterium]
MGLLSPRYARNGEAHVKLNGLQAQMKRQIDRKVEKGVYIFEAIPCPVCQSIEFDPLAEQDRYGLHFPVVICRGCGLVQTNPRMNQTSYDEFYNAEYRRLDEGSAAPTDGSFALQYERGKQLFHSVVRYFTRPPADYFVLEVGCGSGGVVKYFQEQGCRVKGIDLGEEYLLHGRQKHGLDLTPGTLADLALEEAPDVIIYSHVMEHILDPTAELALVRHHLAPGGLLCIEVPGVRFVQHAYDGDFLRMLQNAHTFHFTLQSLTNLLGVNGFMRLAGDELVRGIFTPAPGGKGGLGLVNEAASIRAFLDALESEYMLLAGLARMREGAFPQAAMIFSQLTGIAPESSYAYRCFALALRRMGREKDAVRIEEMIDQVYAVSGRPQ